MVRIGYRARPAGLLSWCRGAPVMTSPDQRADDLRRDDHDEPGDGHGGEEPERGAPRAPPADGARSSRLRHDKIGRDAADHEHDRAVKDKHQKPEVTAVLLNRAGNKMSDVQLAPGAAGTTHQIDLGLASIPTGEYLVEITAKSANGDARELVPFRLGS